ncbi:MAG: sensor signal transduction histidine kinase [Edaphobacter sp.]|nr:sensor signal transduction histidine kinase [Edaphobacter sp.]
MTVKAREKNEERADSPPFSQNSILGTGEMADLTRAFDWSQTPIGPIDQWPETLLITVNTMLATRQPMFLWWGKDLIQFYNDAYRPSLGADKHPRALGQNGIECWPEIWPIIGPQIEAVMSSGQATWHEDQLVPIIRDGKMEDVYWTYGYSPVREPSGSICGTLVVSTETTDRFLAEQRQLTSQEQYQALFELASDAIFVATIDGCVSEANHAACKLLGYTRDELLQLNYADIVAPSERPRLWSARDLLLHGGVSVEEWHLVAKNGSSLATEISAAILPDGRWQAFVRDITDRKRLEEDRFRLIRELQQQHERLADLFQQAPAFFAVLRGPEFIFEMINPLYRELMGQRDLIGKSVRQAVPEAEGQGFIDLLDEVYRTGKPFVGRRTPIHLARTASPSLEERFLDFVYQPRREPDGTISGIIALGVDVTESKRAELALMQTEKLAAVGRLASSIAHEINNPLESVTNLLYLARETAWNPETREYLEIADRELRRVSLIANQTLRFHKQSSRPQLITCEELIGGAISVYQGRLVNSNVEVERRKRAKQPVLCFEGEIRQVLSNLIANAIDAMHPNGGRLLMRSREGTDWKTGRKGLIVTVADTGSGMSSDTAAKIFEPFFTTKEVGGTGLGLWVSHQIIERHGGTLTVRSSQRKGNSGAVFTLFLPFEAVVR